MMNCYIKNYPRPQFVRKEWENLNGNWDFRFDDENIGEQEQWYQNFGGELVIQVPFTYETKLSGIQDEKRHDYIWYHRTINVDKAKLERNRYVIHFEGSDFLTKLWVNGQYAGSKRGGYSRFSFDVSDLLCDGENEITVKVEDSFDLQQPRGKQRWKDSSYGCWYVQTTGIWKTVWSEYVPKISLAYVKMTPNLSESCLNLEFEVDAEGSCYGRELIVEAVAFYEGEWVNQISAAITAKHTAAKLDLENRTPEGFVHHARNWFPDKPCLYDIEFRVFYRGQLVDEVGSYFAMREMTIKDGEILLNGLPLYQRLILDQGYWKDSHLTPPSEEALIEDIDKIHALGYNGVRKHQKIEDERFLYWCDVKGMLVWSEAAAAYEFSDYALSEFAVEWMEIVKQNYNHPCIVTWTPFNESWGVSQICNRKDQQHFTEAIYHLTKSMDPYRPVIVNDGWEHTVSDILTLHDYEASGECFEERYSTYWNGIVNGTVTFNGSFRAFSNGFQYCGQPVIISEFGGIAFNNDDSGWGYGEKVTTEEAFIRRFDAVTTAIKKLPHVCGYCYTQVTDVQQEINGLMDAERNFKVNPEIIKEINTRKVSCK